MPVYSYRCENCGAQFDKTRKFSDPPLTQCPVCGEQTLRKVYTPVGIVFKGSGFYATDHRSPSGSNRADSKGGSNDKAADSKPADSAPASAPSTPPATSSSST